MHKQTCVVRNEVVGNLEVFTLRLNARLPSDAIDN